MDNAVLVVLQRPGFLERVQIKAVLFGTPKGKMLLLDLYTERFPTLEKYGDVLWPFLHLVQLA